MLREFRVLILGPLSMLILASVMGAQAYTPDDMSTYGLVPGATFQGGEIDSVNLLNGNVVIQAPLYSLPQRGKLSASYKIESNNIPYILVESVDPNTGLEIQQATINPNATEVGPTIARSTLVSNWGVISIPNVGCGGSTLPCDYSDYYWITATDETGAVHPLFADAGGPANTFRSVDGAGYLFLAQSNLIEGTLHEPNGVTHNIQVNNNGLLTASSERDLDGFTITANITQVPNSIGNNFPYITSITDTMNRNIPTPMSYGSSFGPLRYMGPTLSSETEGCPIIAGSELQPLVGSTQWTVPGPDGGTATYLLCYAQITASTNFWGGVTPNDNGLSPETGINQPMLQSIVLPGASGYWYFLYDSVAAGDFTTPSYGSVTKVGLPTGGSISYTYQPVTPSPNTCSALMVIERQVDFNDGNGPQPWTYQYNQSLGNGEYGTIVTDPEGNQTTVEFNLLGTCFGVESKRRIYHKKGQNQILLRTIATQYQYGILPDYAQAHWQEPLAPLPKEVDTIESGGEAASTLYQYDSGFNASWKVSDAILGTNVLVGTPVATSFGRKTETIVKDYSGQVLTDTLVSYVFQNTSSPYYAADLLDLPSVGVIKNAGGFQVAKTTYGYDENNGSPQGVYGHATSISRWLDVANQYLSATSVYNPEGQASSGKPSDIYDGNWNAAVATRPGTHTQITYDSTGIFPSTVKRMTGNQTFTTIYSYDANTGNLKSSTDPNGITTSNVYSDPLGRLTLTKSAFGTSSEAWSSKSYPTLNEVDAASDQLAKGDALITGKSIIDGVGHVLTQVDPAGNSIETKYDALGRVSSVSNPHGGSAASTDGSTSYVHDALGRKIVQIAQDGVSTRTWCYDNLLLDTRQHCHPNSSNITAASFVDVTDENGNDTQQITDALGELVAVVEPDPVTGILSMQTTYTYNARGDLMSVNQAGEPTNGDLPRNRSFSYDSLSRIETSWNPEAGTICYGLYASGACTSSYDANGNLMAKTDAAGRVTNYAYDGFSRLISKSVTYPASLNGGSTSPLSTCYLYDTAILGKGHVAMAWTQTGLCPTSGTGPSASTLTTATIYQSYDPLGRLLKSRQCVLGNCSAQTPFSQIQSYDLADNLTSWMDGINQNLFIQASDTSGRVKSISSAVWIDSYHPATLFSIQPQATACAGSPLQSGYNAAGSLQGYSQGNNLNISRCYDSQLRVTSETVTVP